MTLIRSVVRGLLRAAPDELGAEIRAALRRDDDYEQAGKPHCDWDDAQAREALVDALAQDASAALEVIEDRDLPTEVWEAAGLVATVVGQDLERGDDGRFRIVRGVASGRIISTVDRDTGHGHQTNARSFDGYKGHVAVDPDSEIITAAAVIPGSTGDASVADDLLADVLPTEVEPETLEVLEDDELPEVYADSAYGTGPLLDRLERGGVEVMVKVQEPTAPAGHFPKDRFRIDLEARTVTCPAEVTVPIRPLKDGFGNARFGRACAACPLRSSCTDSSKGRVVTVSPYEAQLARSRGPQREPAWRDSYSATRPKVERKIAHLLRRGRRVPVRGQWRIDQFFALLAAAVNLARLAVLDVRAGPGGSWALAG